MAMPDHDPLGSAGGPAGGVDRGASDRVAGPEGDGRAASDGRGRSGGIACQATSSTSDGRAIGFSSPSLIRTSKNPSGGPASASLFKKSRTVPSALQDH